MDMYTATGMLPVRSSESCGVTLFLCVLQLAPDVPKLAAYSLCPGNLGCKGISRRQVSRHVARYVARHVARHVGRYAKAASLLRCSIEEQQ